MPLVIDASAIAPLAFEDEGRDLTNRVLDQLRADRAVVPALWWFEIRNSLIVGERRTRITPEKTAIFLADLRALDIAVDSAPS